jgi:hypothetical protein
VPGSAILTDVKILGVGAAASPPDLADIEPRFAGNAR